MSEVRNILLVLAMVLSFSALAQEKEIPSELISRVEQVADQLELVSPNQENPVSVKSQLVWSEARDQFAVIIKAKTFTKWHIYAYASENSPFITTKVKFENPEGTVAMGEWNTPDPKPYTDGVYIYEGDLLFTRYFKVEEGFDESQVLKAGLYYQACDPYQCLPPRTQLFELK
jgi:hypothetical protein